MNLKTLCLEACHVIKETGAFIRQERKTLSEKSIEVKGTNDFVTAVDKASEVRLVEGLGRLLPESGFIAEEATSSKKGEVFNWIIDPIDGTTNFIHGAPPYSISVALMRNQELVMGIVYEISGDECFYSWEGAPVFLNQEEVTVSKRDKVKDALIATGFPYKAFDRLEPFLKTMVYFMENSHGVRRLGSAAVDLAYVACGRYDAFYEYNLNPWDVAAGAFLIQQAGGHVTDFSGGKEWLFGKEIVAGNGFLFSEFLEDVGNIMNLK